MCPKQSADLLAARMETNTKADADDADADAATGDGAAAAQQVQCGVTQWEQLADAILATPVPRFIENPPVNNNGTTEGILEI